MNSLVPLATQSATAIDALLDSAFGPERRTRTAYRIRRGMAWLTDRSYAALDDSTGAMVGLLQSWPIALHTADGGQTPLVMVGPVAVLPQLQRGGTGRQLMDRLIADSDAAGGDPLMLIGDEPYYGRFWNFSAAETGGWHVLGPVERNRLLARRAGPQGLSIPPVGTLCPRLPVLSDA